MFVSTTGFTRGEVDAALWDRADVDFYRSASKYIENWLPDLTGGITRRPRFDPALIGGDPGAWSVTPVSNAQDVQVAPYVVTTGETDYLVLVFAFRIPTIELPSSFLRVYRVQDQEDGSWALEQVLSEVKSFGSELPPGPLADHVSFAYAGASLFVASPLFPPFRVVFAADGSVAQEVPTWREELLGTVEVAAESSTWMGTDTLFSEQLAPGRTFYFQGQPYVVDTITSNTEMTTTAAYPGPSLGGLRISKGNLYPWGASSAYPSLVAFHRNRLFFFSTPERPTAMWASSPSDPFVILPGSVYDDAPIQAELIAEGSGRFLWASSEDNLYLGSDRGEFIIATPYDLPLTPTSLSFSRISSIGGAGVTPILSESSTLFVPRTRARVLASEFDEAVQGFRASDLCLLSPHLVRGGVAQMALRPATRSDPVPRLFVVTQDGHLRACALSEQEGVAAWTRVTLPPGDRPIAVAASPAHAYVFALRQNATGEEAVGVLRLDDRGEPLAGEAARALAGELDYAFGWDALTGDPVPVPAALRGHSALVVSSVRGAVGHTPPLGEAVDFSDYGWEAGRDEVMALGVPFRSRLEPLPAAGEDKQGPWLSRRRRLVRAMVSVRDTAHLLANGQPLLGALGTQAGRALPKFSGVLEYRQLGWGTGEDLILETSTHYPAQVLSIVREVNT